MSKNYWVCHVRGPNFEQLRRKGFVVLYPAMDDYVFLEASPANLPLLKRQTELGVSFLKHRNKLSTVTQEEIDRMTQVTTDLVMVGSKIEVISGFAENLNGVVLEIGEKELLCELDGYKRKYTVWVDKLDLVELKPVPNNALSDS